MRCAKRGCATSTSASGTRGATKPLASPLTRGSPTPQGARAQRSPLSGFATRAAGPRARPRAGGWMAAATAAAAVAAVAAIAPRAPRGGRRPARRRGCSGGRSGTPARLLGSAPAPSARLPPAPPTDAAAALSSRWGDARYVCVCRCYDGAGGGERKCGGGGGLERDCEKGDATPGGAY